MTTPKNVSLKRRHSEDPPEILVLQRPNDEPSRYIRRARKELVLSGAQDQGAYAPPRTPHKLTREGRPKAQKSQRTFYLSHSASFVAGSKRGAEDAFPTFTERQASEKHGTGAEEAHPPRTSPAPPPAQPLKRPSRGAAVKGTLQSTMTPETEAQRELMASLSVSMHQAALEEVQRDEEARMDSPPQLKRIATPRLSGHQSRAIHQRRTATNASLVSGKDAMMQDDSDYVYDTYVLASSHDDGMATMDAHSLEENVGYLVITEEDQSLWETYLDDESSDHDLNSDEEDENAEDYYGADYPEDELASDDEFDRGAHYRSHGAADDEEWDEDTGAYSGDEDEYDRVMNSFKSDTVPQQSVIPGGAKKGL